MLKKFSVFIISFFLLFIAFQLVSGWILTVFYTPSFTSVANEEVSFGGTSNLLISVLFIASAAYFLSQLKFSFLKTHSN